MGRSAILCQWRAGARIVRAQQPHRPNHRDGEFPLLTETAIREGRAERVLECLRAAAKDSVEGLMIELHHQSVIGNINYKNMKTTRLHEILTEHLGTTYTYEAIRRHCMN